MTRSVEGSGPFDPLAPEGYFMDAQANVFVCRHCGWDKDRGHSVVCTRLPMRPQYVPGIPVTREDVDFYLGT